MKQVLEEQLRNRFTFYDPIRHLVWWHRIHWRKKNIMSILPPVDCQDGWFQLIWDLSIKIETALKEKEQTRHRFKLGHIADRGGVLQVVWEGSNQVIDQYITEAIKLSTTICAVCGSEKVLENNIKVCPQCKKPNRRGIRKGRNCLSV